MIIKKLSSRSSLSDLYQNTDPFTEIENSFRGSYTSLPDDMDIQKASSNTPSTARNSK